MEADAEEDAAAGEDEVGVEVVELVELDEQPATAKTDSATTPERPAIRRVRLRGCVRFMAPSVRSTGVRKVSDS